LGKNVGGGKDLAYTSTGRKLPKNENGLYKKREKEGGGVGEIRTRKKYIAA